MLRPPPSAVGFHECNRIDLIGPCRIFIRPMSLKSLLSRIGTTISRTMQGTCICIKTAACVDHRHIKRKWRILISAHPRRETLSRCMKDQSTAQQTTNRPDVRHDRQNGRQTRCQPDKQAKETGEERSWHMQRLIPIPVKNLASFPDATDAEVSAAIDKRMMPSFHGARPALPNGAEFSRKPPICCAPIADDYARLLTLEMGQADRRSESGSGIVSQDSGILCPQCRDAAPAAQTAGARSG